MRTPRQTDTRGFAVYRDGEDIPAAPRGRVIAIGNFDGVHRGHQKLVEITRAAGERRGSSTAVLTFEPHPRAFFAPSAPQFRLTPEAAKLKVLGQLGLDAVFLRRFDASFAALPAADFVRNLLIRELGAAELVVGSNFHFGRGREGTPAFLTALARESGVEVRMAETVLLDGTPVSSSRTRAALERGEVESANSLLGYRWFVQGEVRHGEKRGRVLGYPTANLRLGDGCRLAHGIYAVRVAIAPGTVREGVASFGRRPTFDNGAPLLETYLFDFSGDLYGSQIEVEFVAHLRPEERFDTADALVAQMHRDEKSARGALRRASASAVRSFIG
jgi:riboflavin kinase/FMN adenylyltransferase